MQEGERQHETFTAVYLEDLERSFFSDDSVLFDSYGGGSRGGGLRFPYGLVQPACGPGGEHPKRLPGPMWPTF